MDDSLILLRSVERLCIAAGAIASLYFGYRLFALIPTQKSGSGKIEMPGRVAIAVRGGPGLVFASLGTAVFISIILSPIDVAIRENRKGATKTTEVSYFVDQGGYDLQELIGALNCAQDVLGRNPTYAGDLDALGVGIREAKLAFLEGNAPRTEFEQFSAHIRSGTSESKVNNVLHEQFSWMPEPCRPRGPPTRDSASHN